MHGIGRHAVDARFGFGEQREERERVVARGLRQGRRRDARADRGTRRAVDGVVPVRHRRAAGRVPVARRESEAAGAQPRAVVRREGRPCAVRRAQRLDRGEHRCLERGQRIDHRRDEHVAGEAADEIEMDGEALPVEGVTGSAHATTGTTYGPSGITATSSSAALTSASAIAVSTAAIVSTPVSARSS